MFYGSPVKDVYVKALTPPTESGYLFSSNPTIHVYASALAAYQASAWANYGTIVGDLDDCELISAIEAPEMIDESVNSKFVNSQCYDLFGRRVTVPQPSTIYIRNGKKYIRSK